MSEKWQMLQLYGILAKMKNIDMKLEPDTNAVDLSLHIMMTGGRTL